MIANAYCPSLLFRLPAAESVVAVAAAEVAAAAVPAAAAAGVAVTAEAATGAAVLAAGAGAAEVAVGISDPLLRLVKYAWGSGFFIAAFGCNCLKTAADRHHSWAPQNRYEMLAAKQAGWQHRLTLASAYALKQLQVILVVWPNEF